MPRERWILLTLAAIQFTHIMDFMIMMPLGPQLMRLFAITPQQFGLLVSAYTFSAGLFGFLATFFIDRYDRKKALLALYGGFIMGTFCCALAPAYPFLLGARILTGLFGGITGALVLAVIADVIPAERRATAMGAVMTAFSVASVLGVPFGLYLATLTSWHAPFFFLAGVGLLVWGAIYRMIPSLLTHVNTGPRVLPLQFLRNLLQQPSPRWALLLVSLMMLGQFSVIPFISPAMVSNVGFSETQLAYIYLLGGGVTLFTGPMIGKLADRFGKVLLFVIFALMSTLPTYWITQMGHTPMALALLVTSSFFICAGGRMIPAMAIVSSAVPPHQRGGFMSLYAAVQQLTSGCASLIAGFMVTKAATGELQHYGVVGYGAIICSLLCLLVITRIRAADVPITPEGLTQN